MRSKNLILIILLLFSSITTPAQTITEADGFVWEKFQENGKEGAKDKNGKVIISPKHNSIRYRFADDKNVTVGYFYVEDYTGNKFKYGICDITGQQLLPVKHEAVNLGLKMCGSDTLVYLTSSNDLYEHSTIYDCNGKKITSKVPSYSAENDGYFYNFKTKENLNIKIPCANGKLSKFHTRNDHTFDAKTKDGMYLIYDAKGNIIVPPGKYDYICKHTSYPIIYYSTEKNGKEGACDENGHEIIPPKYDNIVMTSSSGHTYFSTKLNGKEGACEINGTEIIPPIYDIVYWSGEFHCKNNDSQEVYVPQPSKGQSRQPQYASNSGTGNYTSSQTSSYTSSYSSSADKGYGSLSDSNLVDNSEKISKCEEGIRQLENKKRYCTHCNGTQQIPQMCTACRGRGTFSTPPYVRCGFCGGTGRTYNYCIVCRETDRSIGFLNSLMKTYKETHGMTKEVAEFYHKHKNWEAQMDRDFQNAINAIAEPYLNGTDSSHSSASSSSKCSICNGTGIDPHAWHSGDHTPSAGGYTHSSGDKCVYCGKYEWHQHKYCPKCNAGKY